jgi:hypothetical protein
MNAFLPSARVLFGHAALLLGWRPDEFWSATPDELAAALTAALPFAPASHGPPLDRQSLVRLQELNPDG